LDLQEAYLDFLKDIENDLLLGTTFK